MVDTYMHSTQNLEIAASTTTDIRDSTYWVTPLPQTAALGRPFNELTLMNDSANDVTVYLNGDPTKFYVVKTGAGILQIFSYDKLYFSFIQVKNNSAAAVCAARTITVTMRRVY